MPIFRKISKNSISDISNNNIENNKDYKKQIIEILSASSLAYLLSPFRSKRLLIKIIWIIFLIGFFLASIYYVTLNILDYLQYDTVTSIYEIYEPEFEFPTISFCSINDPSFNSKVISIKFQY